MMKVSNSKCVRRLGFRSMKAARTRNWIAVLAITLNTISPQTVERTFTLSGWWKYDQTITANHVLLPRSAAEELCALSSGEQNTMTGKWNLDVMFKNAVNIQGDLSSTLDVHGY